MELPNRIFITGVPGSRWSGIAQHIESISGFNTSDRTPQREYTHGQFSGHKGAYFGPGMEFAADLASPAYLDQAWISPGGTRLVKSHHWAYMLPEIKTQYPSDWIMLVYRPDIVSYAWWHEAGGFQIKYPSYASYIDSTNMLKEIVEQNKQILKFSNNNDAQWSHFSSTFIKKELNADIEIDMQKYSDCLVTIIKS